MGIDWFGMVFGLGLAVSFGYWCTDFLQVQRVIVAKDLRSAQNGTIIGAVLKMLRAADRDHPRTAGPGRAAATPTARRWCWCPRATRGRTSPTTRSTTCCRCSWASTSGPGLLGLGVTAMIAGFMSGMAGNVSAFATVWTYDVYRPLIRKNASDAHYLSMGRWCSLLGVLMSIGTAYALLLFLEHPRVPPGAHLLLHRAAVRRGDPGHAVEAGDAGGRPSGAS